MNKVKLKVVRQRKGWIVLRDYGSQSYEACPYRRGSGRVFSTSNYNNRGLDVTVHLSAEGYEAARQQILFNKRG